MEILDLILAALKSQSTANILTIAGVYIVSPLLMYMYVQYIKQSRKDAGQPLGSWTLRGIASGGTYCMSVFIGWRLGGWSLADASDHALAIAVAFPLAVTVILNRVGKLDHELGDELGGAPTEFRMHDDDKTDAPKP